MPTAIDVFSKVRGHERAEQLKAAREADLLPYFRTLESPAGPVVEMEGAERIMLGSNNYLGLTDDPRVIAGARDALDQYGTGLTGSRLLNGTTGLHLELEREIAEWMGTEDALVFTTGHQANVGTLGTILAPGDTVIADSGDHASILDGCLLSRAKLRPFRHNRLDKLETMLQRAGDDGGGVLVVVDGVFSMEGDVAPLPQIVELCRAHGARLMVDEAHGAGVLGARGAGTAELFGVESQRRPADGHVLEVARLLRRLHRRLPRGHRLPAHPVARVPLHRRRRARRGRRRARRAAGHPLRGRSAALRPRARERRLPEHRAARARPPRRRAAAAARRLDGHDADRPGRRRATTGRPSCCGARSTTRASSSTSRCIRRCPPAGALLRTSVMATHDRATLDLALERFASVVAAFEAEHGPSTTRLTARWNRTSVRFPRRTFLALRRGLRCPDLSRASQSQITRSLRMIRHRRR